jgi:hypothetical protein
LLMGIQHAAQHQFAAGVDEFDDHAARVSSGVWRVARLDWGTAQPRFVPPFIASVLAAMVRFWAEEVCEFPR